MAAMGVHRENGADDVVDLAERAGLGGVICDPIFSRLQKLTDDIISYDAVLSQGGVTKSSPPRRLRPPDPALARRLAISAESPNSPVRFILCCPGVAMMRVQGRA